ncbi:MlaD family protein [Gordonia crocea]|nr:MlaD family protein [Gordonia crocea]
MTVRNRWNRVVRAVAAVGLVAALSTGCATFSVEKLPAPGASGDSWPLHVEFGTVMNLPTESKVTVNGLRAGIVSEIAPAPEVAKVTLRLEPSTVVGRNATVELRQDTMLGDTYVAITNPPDAYSTPIEHGGTLGRDHVKAPVQIEGLLNSLANFVGSGSLPQLGNTFDRLTKQFPKDPEETRRASRALVGTLNALSAQTQNLNTMLASVSDIGQQLAKMEDQLRFVFSDEGSQFLDSATIAAQIVDLLARLQGALIPALPAVPVFTALAQLLEKVVKPLLIPGWPNYFGQASNPQAMLNILTDRIVPFLKAGPAVDVNRIAIENDVSNKQLADLMLRQLRMMGLAK